MTDKQIDKKVDEINELQRKASELKDQIEALKDQLRKECDKRQVDSIETKFHKVSYTCFEQRRVDSEKLKADGIYDKYSKVGTQFRLTLSDLKPL